MLRERFPLYGAGRYLSEISGELLSIDGGVGLATFTFCLLFALSWYLLFSFAAARLTGKGFAEAFELFAWSLLPLFAFSSFSQMGEFFSFRYYPMIAEALLDLVGRWREVAPLASMNAPWLSVFKLFALGGGLWSMGLAWRMSGRLTETTWKRGAVALPFWFLYLLVLSAFVAHMIVMLYLDLPAVTGPRH